MPVITAHLNAARERALTALYDADSWIRNAPISAANNSKFHELWKVAQAELRRYESAGGAPLPAATSQDPERRLAQLIDHFVGPVAAGASPVAGLPAYPGSAGDTGAGGSRSWGLGAGVVSAFEQRGIRYGAELVSSANVPVAVPLRAEPVADPRAARFIADIIPEEDAPGGRFSHWKQTVRTNNAAAVARLARKPTSIYTGTRVNDEVTTVAHLSEPVSRFDLSDAPMLRQFLTDELEYGLRLGLDDEIVNGDGVAPSMLGILDQATAEPATPALLTTTRNGITTLEELETAPSHFVFSPATWQAIEEEAQTTYATLPAMSPLDATARRLHGFPVVVSNAVPNTIGILGDFRTSAILYRTGPIMVDWSENMYRSIAEMGDGAAGTDFARNAITFRAELRAKLAILRPAAFLALDLTIAT